MVCDGVLDSYQHARIFGGSVILSNEICRYPISKKPEIGYLQTKSLRLPGRLLREF